MMKVAIIGAGLGGLSCAFELKKAGIIPTIFEKRSQIGEMCDFSGAWLRLFSQSFIDSPSYLRKKYSLKLTPLHPIKEIAMKGPKNTVVVKGNLGYLFKRGIESYSLENQIAKTIDIPITFDKFIDYSEITALQKEFDYVVISTGDSTFPKSYDAWTEIFKSCIRIATVVGSFKPNAIKMWLNTKYAKAGYAYLMPHTEKEANLILIVSDISHNELDFYWKEFLYAEQIDYTITETRDLEHFIGYVNPVQIGNLYFVGNAAGMIDNFLGFGALQAIESGILAARAITKKLDYQKLVQNILNSIKLTGEFRQAINTFSNDDFDKLLSLINLPALKQFMYNNPFFKAMHSAYLAKIYNNFKN